MARPTLTTHPKFFRLAALVGGRGAARGALELIWDAAYASGDPVVGDSIAVEAVADWRGKPGDLTAAMVSSGFLDEMQTDANGSQLHVFAVHDLEDHAPDYVLKRWQREAERRQNGDTIRSVRQRAATLRWGAVKQPEDASVRRLQSNVLPPAPAPITDLSLSGSGSIPLPHLPPAPERAIPVPPGTAVVVPPARPDDPVSGPGLGILFAEVRAEVLGGLSWKTPRLDPAKAASAADAVNENAARAELRPSLEEFWRSVGDGTRPDAQKCSDSAAWAFGCWAGGFQAFVERARGLAPKTRAGPALTPKSQVTRDAATRFLQRHGEIP